MASHREVEAKQLLARVQAMQPKSGWLGLQLRRLEDARSLFVEQVIADSPAAKAGFQQGDQIIRFNGHEVQGTEAFIRMVTSLAPETPVNVEVLRSSQTQAIQVILGTRPEAPISLHE